MKMDLTALMRYVFLDLSYGQHLILPAAYHSNNVCYCQSAYLIFTNKLFGKVGLEGSCKHVMLLPLCFFNTLKQPFYTNRFFFQVAMDWVYFGVMLFHRVEYFFFSALGIFEPWHCVLLKAADCSLHRVMEGNHTRSGITL